MRNQRQAAVGDAGATRGRGLGSSQSVNMLSGQEEEKQTAEQ
jgi:hypothetical protein